MYGCVFMCVQFNYNQVYVLLNHNYKLRSGEKYDQDMKGLACHVKVFWLYIYAMREPLIHFIQLSLGQFSLWSKDWSNSYIHEWSNGNTNEQQQQTVRIEHNSIFSCFIILFTWIASDDFEMPDSNACQETYVTSSQGYVWASQQ